MRTAILLIGLAGCSFKPGGFGASNPDATGDDDAAAEDAIDDDALRCSSWSSTHFDGCAIPNPTGEVHLLATATPYTFDTTTGGGTLVDKDGASVAILSADVAQASTVHAALWTMEGFTIDTNVELFVIGTKPLIIAAWGSIVVNGTIDVGSHVGGRTGAGANPASCSGHAATVGGDGDSGNGGGGGGGNKGNGGPGGKGDGNCSGAPACIVAGGGRGTAIAAPATVEGGCDGAASGAATGTRAPGGKGGGAILLAANGTITIAGVLRAGGAGGAGDPNSTISTGGGGGGAGGFIGLEAASVSIAGATLAANGGGGGGAGDIAQLGTAGTDGDANTTAASGGPAGGSATNGGAGSSRTVLDGLETTESTMNGGGGGGGGGAGFILYWTTALDASTATTSPPEAAGP